MKIFHKICLLVTLLLASPNVEATSIWGSTDRGPVSGSYRIPVDTGASSSPGYITPNEIQTFLSPTSIANGGTGQITAAAALQAVSTGMMIDPRQYGAVCDGATFSGGIPVQNGSDDDTAGFIAAQLQAALTGGVVMVPDGCWVKNLPMFTGITMIGQNWSPNYGYDYGTGSLGYTLSITPGSGYTNGTYLLQASGGVSGSSGFNTGLSITSGTSVTSVTIGTGSKSFTTAARTGTNIMAVNQPMIVYDSTSVTNGTAANFMFGLVTSDDGTTMVVNVTQISGSGTITTWNIHKANFIVVSGGKFGAANATGFQVNNAGTGYPVTATIPLPSAAGAGTGGLISTIVRPSGQPFAKPMLYVIGHPTFGINVNGAETVSFIGFEVNAFSDSNASGITACIGDDSASQGFGGKIWLYQMSMKGCSYGFQGSSSCFDYLVSQNTDYAANATGIGGCFSDFLSQGDTFASGTCGIAGSGGGFARVSNDRFEYLTEGICPSTTAFLELSIVDTQFDHTDTCNIDLGTTWNDVTMTGGALKAGGVAGSLTTTGTNAYTDGQIEMTVNSAIGSIHGGQAITLNFRKVPTILDTSSSSIAIGTGAKTFTTATSLGLQSRISGTDGTQTAGTTTFTSATSTFTGGGSTGNILNITACTGTGCSTGFYKIVAFVSTHVVTLDRTITDGVHNITASTFTADVPLLIYNTSSPANWMYGSVTSDVGTSLVMNITSVGGSGTIASWSLGRPFFANVASVGGTTEANQINWPITVADSNNIVLQNSTWANAWTSGGRVGIQGKDADICMSGSTTANGGLTLSNVGYYSSSALGQQAAPAYIIEASSAGNKNDYVALQGSTLLKAGGGVTINYNGFSMGVEDWLVSAPPHYLRQAMGVTDVNPSYAISAGNVFTVSGCSITLPVGGPTAGQFVSGTTGTCTAVITMNGSTGITAPNGWSCAANDQTTPTDILTTTSSNTTTATIAGTTVSGDVISFACFGY